MPWIQTDPMNQRTRFVLAYEDGLYSMTELCERFGVSRKTGYKWLHRYLEQGLDGLKDQSRAPHHCPHQTPACIEELLVEARRSHPRWGPRKLIDYLRPRHPAVIWPAASTVGALLKRHGLVKGKRRRRKTKHPGAGTLVTTAPNQVWGADFKGEFRMRNGQYCYPLTVTDAHSRYLLACQGLPSTRQKGAFEVFEDLFKQMGLPLAIRTDNGPPFATRALCGLSRLNVWWIKLGIVHQRIEPGKPQQNARHERMHRTLKAETCRPPEREMTTQQGRFDAFRWEFNHERPHEALGGAVPASVYVPSARAFPAQLPEPGYLGHYEVRQVSTAGMFRFKQRQVFISQTLARERIALEEVADGLWSVYFYDVLLARLDERDFRLRP